jgi:hypothetical protein
MFLIAAPKRRSTTAGSVTANSALPSQGNPEPFDPVDIRRCSARTPVQKGGHQCQTDSARGGQLSRPSATDSAPELHDWRGIGRAPFLKYETAPALLPDRD